MSARPVASSTPSPAGAHRQVAGRLVIATHNPGKLREMRELLAPYGIDAVSAGELGLAEPDETGASFHDNARIKAIAAAAASNGPAFSDDSGLVVDALDGAPGIHSARWAGPGKDFGAAMQRVDQLLREHDATRPEQRTAHFVSALCIAGPTATSRSSRPVSTARWSGRRAGRWVSATTRCSCPTATPAPSARCRPRRSTGCHRAAKACRIGRAPSASSRRPVCASGTSSQKSVIRSDAAWYDVARREFGPLGREQPQA